MSERLQDADRAVDEQKRRARRRLVGAVVLAAAAAVIVPMLLEKEPQPLGEDVSVQIPPVDEGKFVNRLTRSKGETPAKPEAKGTALPPKSEPAKPDTPKPDAAKPEAPKADAAKPETPKADAPSADAAKPASSEPVVATPSTDASAAPGAPAAAPAKSIGQAEQRMLAPAPPKSTPPADTRASAPAKATPAPAATALPAAQATDATAAPAGSFAVQLAAFSDDKGANSLANKLKKAGYASAHVETVDTSHGKLWRVRVGGYASRAEAEAARVKLKSEGFNGMVAPAR